MAAIHFNAARQSKPFGNRQTGVRGAPDADQDLFGCVFLMLAIADAVGVIFVLKTLIYLLHFNP
jgi:F0F1-type ATP synthase membrane subunit c/vacuolar-type H+-ATPase subunit K